MNNRRATQAELDMARSIAGMPYALLDHPGEAAELLGVLANEVVSLRAERDNLEMASRMFLADREALAEKASEVVARANLEDANTKDILRAIDDMGAELDKPTGANLIAVRDAWKNYAQAQLEVSRLNSLIAATKEDHHAEYLAAVMAVSDAFGALRALNIDPEDT